VSVIWPVTVSTNILSDELVIGRLNPSVERPAPRHATPVSFPNFDFLKNLEALEWNKDNKPNLFDLRLKWQYPPHGGVDQALGIDVFKTINVTFEPVGEFDQLFKTGDNSALYLPSADWGTTEPDAEQRKAVNCPTTKTAQGQVVAQKLSNGRPFPTRGDFWERANQLRLSNIDGFRGYARISIDDRPIPRVTHARPFFEHLDGMVQYWDTSLDEYIPPNSIGSSENDNKPRKRTKLSPDDPDMPSPSSESCAPSSTLSAIATPIVPPTESVTLADATISMHPKRPNSSRRTIPGFRRGEPSPPPVGTYRGWRIDSGKNMPNGTRDLLVKALLEIAMWPFGFHVDTSERQPPRVEIQALRVSVPLTRRIWRPPTDRIEAKMGTVYGPVLGMSARPMTGFDENKIYSEVDLLREFGTLLLLAQERNRMGRREKRPGEGLWWDEKPRWAGMPYEVPGEYPGLYQTPSNDSDIIADTASTIDTKGSLDQKTLSDQKEKRLLGYTARKEKERQRRREELPSDMTARQRSIHSYKKFAPSVASWEPKAKYVPIGKEPGSDWDEVSY
jgi:hypothetical protein